MNFKQNIKNRIIGLTHADMIPSIYWGQIYNSTIADSTWLKDKSISPGRWAVGYEFLYVLYRTLNETKPKRILELGLGQSTRLTSQYADMYHAVHIVCEQDASWIDFFLQSWQCLGHTDIKHMPISRLGTSPNRYWAYDDFSQVFSQEEFDLILIDGPWGGEGSFSRRDVLPLLPHMLKENFVILLDDCGRKGENRTVADIENILQTQKIDYAKGVYAGGGTKITTVISSMSRKFLCTL